MTAEQKRALKKRLVELLVAALTALIAALTTSCSIKWSSNSFELLPYGHWSIGGKAPLQGTNAPGQAP